MTSGSGAEAPAGGGRLAFKSHLRPVVVPGEAVYLLSDGGVTAVRGSSAEALAPLLDGSRSLAEVLRETSGTVPADEAQEAVLTLLTAGLLTEHGTERTQSPAAEAYWDLAGLEGREAAGRISRAGVRVVALGGTDATEAMAACAASGLGVVPEGAEATEADLTLVVCTDYLDPRLAALDRAQRAAGRPWLLAKPVGATPWTGPVLRPGDGPCWHCLAEPLRRNRRSEWPVRRALGLQGPPARPEASLPAGRALGLHSAVLEAAKWLAGLRHESHEGVLVLETLTGLSRLHRVRRRPQCPECGDAGLVAARTAAPFAVAPRPKADTSGNGHRALTARQVLDRYGHLVSPVTGVVRELRGDPRSPGFTHACLSGPNLALEAHSLDGIGAGLRSLSGGKGLTETEARAGALCEAVERYSATRHGDEKVVRASHRELGEAAVHPNSVQLYGEEQLRERARWNADGSPFGYVPEPFDEDAVRDWTPLWSLTSRTQRLLPTSMLYFSATDHDPGGLRADSNGNAAGGSPEDALLQGALELVERDAVALWWYNRTRQPAVDLDAFAEPWLRRLVEGYRSLGREVWALDLTSDLGIPVVVALSRRTDQPAQDVLFGFGAHLDPRIALRRAMTEMGQLLPAVAAARPDGTGYAAGDERARAWWRLATVAGQPHLLPDPELTPLVPAAGLGHPDLAADIAYLTEVFAARGLEFLVLDQTRPDIGLPVVKAVVPGLRPFWARFAPGRLYDVPVALGRLERPTPTERLNPVHMFM